MDEEREIPTELVSRKGNCTIILATSKKRSHGVLTRGQISAAELAAELYGEDREVTFAETESQNFKVIVQQLTSATSSNTSPSEKRRRFVAPASDEETARREACLDLNTISSSQGELYSAINDHEQAECIARCTEYSPESQTWQCLPTSGFTKFIRPGDYEPTTSRAHSEDTGPGEICHSPSRSLDQSQDSMDDGSRDSIQLLQLFPAYPDLRSAAS